MESRIRGFVAFVAALLLAAASPARADEPEDADDADDAGIPGEADWASKREGKEEEPEQKPAAKPRVLEPPPPPRTPEEKRRRTAMLLRFGGVGVAGAGAVTLGAAAYYGSRARSLSREATRPVEMWTAELDQKVADARSREKTALVLLGVGATAVVLGGAAFGASFVLFSEPAPGPGAAPAMTVAPGLLPGGAGLVLEGRFW